MVKAIDFSPVVNIRNARFNAENTLPGIPFNDFDGVSADGSATKLSDYVGKGNYVLVDFWASWCGPCRNEMPIIKEVYNKYKDKGLLVLGANVWDSKESFEKAASEMGLVWPQLCNFENSTATDAYGINGIPYIILFAPAGKIEARGIHGDGIKAIVAKIYLKN